MTKNKSIYHAEDYKSMKGRGVTKTFPSIYVPSVINWFISCHGVVIYFIMQSLYILYSKQEVKLTLFSLLATNLQYAILFILSTAAAIIAQIKSYEISFMSTHSVVKLNCNRNYVCLCNAVLKWR